MLIKRYVDKMCSKTDFDQPNFLCTSCRKTVGEMIRIGKMVLRDQILSKGYS